MKAFSITILSVASRREPSYQLGPQLAFTGEQPMIVKGHHRMRNGYKRLPRLCQDSLPLPLLADRLQSEGRIIFTAAMDANPTYEVSYERR